MGMTKPGELLPSAQDAEPVAWAVERWNAEVANRPLQNIHRRSLDGIWRQVIRHFGGDPDALVGPDHQERVNAEGLPAHPPVAPQAGLRAFIEGLDCDCDSYHGGHTCGRCKILALSDDAAGQTERADERRPDETGDEYDHRQRMASFTPEQRALVERQVQQFAPQPAVAMGREIDSLEALDNSQSLLTMLYTIDGDAATWKHEGVSALLAEQISENRAVLTRPAPEAERLDAATATKAYAEVVRQGDAIFANQKNDIQDRWAIRTFVDRFRALAGSAS